jgi:hypothetical protein
VLERGLHLINRKFMHLSWVGFFRFRRCGPMSSTPYRTISALHRGSPSRKRYRRLVSAARQEQAGATEWTSLALLHVMSRSRRKPKLAARYDPQPPRSLFPCRVSSFRPDVLFFSGAKLASINASRTSMPPCALTSQGFALDIPLNPNGCSAESAYGGSGTRGMSGGSAQGAPPLQCD